jgi:hypothetical protein
MSWNQSIQKSIVANSFPPELICVTAGAYSGGVGNAYLHNTNPYPAGVTVTGTYYSIQLNGKTAKLMSPPATSPLVNVITIGHTRIEDSLATVFANIALDRGVAAPTGPGANDELRIRLYNTANTSTTCQGIQGLYISNFQQSPLLNVDLSDKNSNPVSLGAFQLQARLLCDGTIALTKVAFASGVESAITYSQLNAVLNTSSNDVLNVTINGRALSGLI